MFGSNESRPPPQWHNERRRFLWFNLSFYVFSLKDQNASSGLFIF